MTHIAFVMPDPAMVETVHEAWALHEKIFGKNPELRYTVDCEIQPEVVMAKHYNADVIVSRGGTAASLKNSNFLVPVVEIPVTSSDIRDSIQLAFDIYGEMPVGIVGTTNTLRSTFLWKNTFSVPVKSYVTASVNIRDLVDGMERAVADGCRIILAGHNTCKYCKDHGVPAGLIRSSVESIFLAITEAKRCANLAQVERQNSLIFRSVVDHVHEGIISVDESGIIRTFNPVAAQTLGRTASEVIGNPVRQVLPEGRLSSILAGKQMLSNEIVKIGSNNFVLNSTPMMHNDQRLGSLVTFQAAQSVTDAESRLRDKLRTSGYTARYHFEDVLGDSMPLRIAIKQAMRFAHVDSNILLFGESGTGKEVFAQSIHNESERASGPFVAVNCAAIPENLIESEMFGYEAGAFTGASKTGKSGFFEDAHNGTIFLDEVSEIPLALQSRLLRVIQEREVRRIGANKVTPINVRIICATNRNLLEMIEKDQFREDLYYRLKVLSLQIPALREREGDVMLLIRHYTTYYSQKFGKDRIVFSPDAASLLENYTWPGNIRELRNVCEQLVVLCDNSLITGSDVAAVLPRSSQKTAAARAVDDLSDDSTIEAHQKQMIIDMLAQTSSRADAAKALGISKTTLWRKCKKFGLE